MFKYGMIKKKKNIEKKYKIIINNTYSFSLNIFFKQIHRYSQQYLQNIPMYLQNEPINNN